MSDETTNQAANAKPLGPPPMGALAVGALLPLIPAGLAVAMWMNPDPMGGAVVDHGRAKTRMWSLIFDWLWSKPAAVVLVLVALFFVSAWFSMLRARSKGARGGAAGAAKA